MEKRDLFICLIINLPVGIKRQASYLANRVWANNMGPFLFGNIIVKKKENYNFEHELQPAARRPVVNMVN